LSGGGYWKKDLGYQQQLREEKSLTETMSSRKAAREEKKKLGEKRSTQVSVTTGKIKRGEGWLKKGRKKVQFPANCEIGERR